MDYSTQPDINSKELANVGMFISLKQFLGLEASTNIASMSRQDMYKFAESIWPNENFSNSKHSRNQILFRILTRLHLPEVINSYGILEYHTYYMGDLFATPDNLDFDPNVDQRRFSTNEIKQIHKLRMKEFEDWVVKQEFTVIFNQKSPEEEMEKGPPNRYMTVKNINSRNADTPKILKNILSKCEKLARSINPLFEIFEPRILKSDPGLPMQMLHGDNTVVEGEHAGDIKGFHAMAVSGIVALYNDTSIDIQLGTKLQNIPIQVGNCILFKSKTPHCGAANESESQTNYRLHFSMKKPLTKLVDNTVTFFEQCQWCKMLFRVGDAMRFHKKDCSKRSDSYSLRRKESRRMASRRYYEKNKKMKISADDHSNHSDEKQTELNHDKNEIARSLLFLKSEHI